MSEPAVAPVASDPFTPVFVPGTAPDSTSAPMAVVETPAAPAAGQQQAATPTTAGIPAIPSFEGAPVATTSIKISGATSVETYGDEVVSLDDRVRLIGEYRCVQVTHMVDPKTGDAVRVQILKPLSVTLCPWDPSDPKDNGIVKARP